MTAEPDFKWVLSWPRGWRLWSPPQAGSEAWIKRRRGSRAQGEDAGDVQEHCSEGAASVLNGAALPGRTAVAKTPDRAAWPDSSIKKDMRLALLGREFESYSLAWRVRSGLHVGTTTHPSSFFISENGWVKLLRSPACAGFPLFNNHCCGSPSRWASRLCLQLASCVVRFFVYALVRSTLAPPRINGLPVHIHTP